MKFEKWTHQLILGKLADSRLIILFSASYALGFSIPLILQGQIDSMRVASITSFLLATITVCIICAAEFLTSMLRQKILLRISEEVDSALSVSISDLLFGMPSRVRKLTGASRVAQTLVRPEAIRRFFGGAAPMVMFDAAASLIAAAVVAIYSPITAAMIIVTIMIIFFTTRRGYKMRRVDVRALAEVEKRRFSMFSEYAQAADIIRMSDWMQHFKRKLTDNLENLHTVRRAHIETSDYADYGAKLLIRMSTVVIAVYGASRISTGGMTYGEFFAVQLFAMRALAPMTIITYWTNELQVSLTHLEDLNAFRPEGDKTAYHQLPIAEINHIACTNLTIYRKRRIFEGVSFAISNPGLYTILGSNGCGKTTLLEILSGLETEYDGTIMLNSTPLSSIAPEDLWRTVSLATQKPFIFNSSILENIDPTADADKSRIRHIFEQLGFAWLGKTMESRVLEEGGAGLSGGERRAIALTRALYKVASVYIFDEPTNDLSEPSVDNLVRMLTELANDHIVLLATHDRRIINASMVAVPRDGWQRDRSRPISMIGESKLHHPH
ncbi:MAG: ATP-binding cassette domain-containing protein [Paraburkholderia sp.]|uniref:ATP-binding cassette domain-containing protein n=1 Tax=Paraburkholderia sp. TaxID=1926495 RepID=UPI0011F48ACF|nr:ATP-binding cassette domain-containing protein [Paraburkholderia sp.]TAM32183.1 MAG: ATP-binding cassette domain-containing protein [Paraburkholderia sp.]